MTEQDFKITNKTNHEYNKSIKKMWEIMAQRPSDFDMEVIDALKSTITQSIESTQLYKCYGETIYHTIRQHLSTYKTPDNKTINFLIEKNNNHQTKNSILSDKKVNKNKINIKKADQIRLESTINKLNERLIIMLKSLNLSTFIIPSESIMYSNILEIRAIGFIYISWFLITNKYKDKLIPFSAIVSLQRFINILQLHHNIPETRDNVYIGINAMNPNEHIPVSTTLITDLQHLEQILIKTYSFNGVSLYEQASELILGSQFDIYLPHKAREAFEHQKIVSKTLLDTESLKHGFIMFYRTMTNSGKTSTIINIATAVQELRTKYPTVFGNLQVMATCNVQPVLTRWGQLLYHAGIPFGIATKRNYPPNPELAQRILYKAQREMHDDIDCVDTTMRFSNSDTCKSVRERIAIICTPEIAVKILSNALDAATRFILLHDEPTMYSEQTTSPQLETNMYVMKYAPKWSIFSSATLPYNDNSHIFITHHQTKFPTAKFIDNCSTEIYSCCNLRTFDNKPITPHLGCTTKIELCKIIDYIQQNPFVGKLYTPTGVKLLWDESMEIGIKNTEFRSKVPNLIDYFSKVENLYPNNIRKIAIEILQAITILNDKQIEYICSPDYEDEDESNDDRDISNDTMIQFDKLGTIEAWRFPYLNLIADDNPSEFMKSNYAGLVYDIKRKIGSVDKMIADYDKSIHDWQKGYDMLEKNIKNDDELSRAQSEMCDDRPLLAFPEECQINTKQHVHKYKKSKATGFNVNKYRIPVNIATEMLDELHITDDVKLSMLSGVGYYSQSNTNSDVDTNYLDMILDMTEQKKMESFIADSSICYGTDYPIGGVIITKDFSDKHSLNTIYQLMSRAGRGRKSNNAEIYVDESCASKILDNVKQGIGAGSSEVENMISVFNKIINE